MSPRVSISPRVRALFVLAAIALVIVALHVVSRFGLRGPTGLTSNELSAWFDDPVTAVATIARWVGLALAYYLFVAVATLALNKYDPSEAPTGIRRLVPSGMASAIGLALGLTATAGPAAMHMASTGSATSLNPPESLTLTVIDDPLVLKESRPDRPPLKLVDRLAPDLESAPAPEIWHVRNGDSMWLIAEETLTDDMPANEEVSDETVAAYWRVLIEANQDRLIEPGNPDLILPGQELILPPIARG